MITLIAISFVFMFIGNWLYQQHEQVKFNYAGSYWERLDQKFVRPWFKNNSRPDWQMLYPWIPFIWDGYHCFSWFMKWAYYMPFALMLSVYIGWGWITGITIAYSFVSFTWAQITYKWTFK